jgi:uncharacterized protein (DUF2147 family)
MAPFSRLLFVVCMLLGLLIPGAAFSEPDVATPEGYWKTIDDDGKTAKSVLQLWFDQGKLQGRIVKLFLKQGDNPDPVCEKCSGANKNKKVIGMQILFSLSKDKDEWSGGTILDPESGNTYKCYVQVLDGGKKLKVRGYVGISLLGRTQYWFRTRKPADKVEFNR